MPRPRTVLCTDLVVRGTRLQSGLGIEKIPEEAGLAPGFRGAPARNG